MRALLLLLLGGGLIWAVLKFFPRTDEAGPLGEGTELVIEGGEAGQPAGPATPAGSDGAGLLDASVDRQPLQGGPQPAGGATLDPGTGGQPPASPAGGGFQVPVGQADLIELGALTAHGGDVLGWLRSSDGLLGDDLEHAVAGFVLALEGDRQGARERVQAIGDPEALGGVRWLLQRALAGDIESDWPRASAWGNPLELGLSMRLRAHEAELLLARQGHARAAALISPVLLGELSAPWPASMAALAGWTKTMRKAQLRHRWHPTGDWAHQTIEVQGGDSLTLIRKRYLAEHPDRVICTGLIQRANGMSSDVIHPGDQLRIPTGEVTLLADLDAHWLLYMIDGEVCESWPIGVGAEGNETITGSFSIGEKEVEPTWWPRGRDPVFFGEEDNPLGTHYMTWFRDGVKTPYGFHGTWEPESIGKNESEGCIRLRNEDVGELFKITPLGATFLVQD